MNFNVKKFCRLLFVNTWKFILKRLVASGSVITSLYSLSLGLLIVKELKVCIQNKYSKVRERFSLSLCLLLATRRRYFVIINKNLPNKAT